MANEKEVVKSATVAAKQTAKTGGKASGVIAFCKNLNTWRAFNASGSLVLTGSKAKLSTRFPNYLIKE